jgi:hypothetical protein
LGPIRIGLPSFTSTVLEQPLIQTTTSAAQSITITIHVHGNMTSLQTLGYVADKRERDLNKDAIEHFNGCPPAES